MKKKVTAALLALACLASLAACGKEESPAAWTTADAQSILDSGAFSEELEELDCDMAWMLYRLGDAGLDRKQLTDGAVRRSAGATCEELAVLIFDSEGAAETAKKALEDYIQSQIDSNRDYRPGEVPKLEGKWLDQRGNTLILVVADDLNAAQTAVDGSK